MRLINILIAEDDMYDYESVFRKLSYLNCIGKIIHVGDGEEAIQYLFKTGQYASSENYIIPNLFLLDINMPKVDGKEVLKMIQEKGSEAIKNIPVIIFTNLDDNINNKKCFELGATGYLDKPVQLHHLKDLLVKLELV